jgi:hypothetical protein
MGMIERGDRALPIKRSLVVGGGGATMRVGQPRAFHTSPIHPRR